MYTHTEGRSRSLSSFLALLASGEHASGRLASQADRHDLRRYRKQKQRPRGPCWRSGIAEESHFALCFIPGSRRLNESRHQRPLLAVQVIISSTWFAGELIDMCRYQPPSPSTPPPPPKKKKQKKQTTTTTKVEPCQQTKHFYVLHLVRRLL